MPNAYLQMAQKLANSAQPQKEIANLKLREEDWHDTPGGKIIRSLGSAPSFDDLFTAFTSFGRKNGWTWNPGLPGAHKGKLLDGTLSEGECAIFAGNLQVLAQLPKPFGLGMAHPPDYWPFSGKFGTGFVCDHDLTNIISPLKSNLRTRAQVLHPLPLYLWENHKVLLLNGLVYDPSYGTVAPATDLLGRYQCKATQAKGGKRVIVKLKGHDYVVTTGPSFGVEYLWRAVPADVMPDMPYKGPYTLDEAEV